jgi:CubicO group peptidase (beta-lactamase class C family)
VTVAMLLSHTSGIPDFTRFDDYEALKNRPATTTTLIERFKDKPLEFEPGTEWAYSNSGYIVLTGVLEAVSGSSYADFLSDNIFKPLAMNDSGYDSYSAILPNRAAGYTPTANGVVNADYVDMTIPQGAGGLYSTTRDLLKWEQGLFGGRLLGSQSLRLLTTPVRENYAMGLVVTQENGHTTISHNGAIEGFNTWLGYDPADRTTVIVLGNLNGPGPDRLGSSLMTLAHGGVVTLASERQATQVPPETLRTYEGLYEATPAFTVAVSVVDGKLMAQATGQGPVELFAEVPDKFFLRVVDAQVTFTRDASGAVDGLTLHQGGQDLTARKR